MTSSKRISIAQTRPSCVIAPPPYVMQAVPCSSSTSAPAATFGTFRERLTRPHLTAVNHSKDSHNWKKKGDQKTIRETHEKLKIGNEEVLNCYYAHADQEDNLQVRLCLPIWLLVLLLWIQTHHTTSAPLLLAAGGRQSDRPGALSVPSQGCQQPRRPPPHPAPTITARLTAGTEALPNVRRHERRRRRRVVDARRRL